MRRSPYPHLTELPPELVTREEAAAILGIGNAQKNGRFTKLEHAYVVLNKSRRKVYRRADVEALVYPPMPPDHTDLNTLAHEFGFTSLTTRGGYDRVLQILDDYGVPCHLHPGWHPRYIFPTAEAREALEDYRIDHPRVVRPRRKKSEGEN